MSSSAESLAPVRSYSVPSRPQAVDLSPPDVADDDEVLRPLAVVPVQEEVSAGAVAKAPAGLEVVLADVETTGAEVSDASHATDELAASSEPGEAVATADSVRVMAPHEMEPESAPEEVVAPATEVVAAEEVAAPATEEVAAKEVAAPATEVVGAPAAEVAAASERVAEVAEAPAAEVVGAPATEVTAASERAAEVTAASARAAEVTAASERAAEEAAAKPVHAAEEATVTPGAEAVVVETPAVAASEPSVSALIGAITAPTGDAPTGAQQAAPGDPGVTAVLVTPVSTKVTRGVAKVVHAPGEAPAEDAAPAKTGEDSALTRKSTLLPKGTPPSTPVPVFRPPGAGRTTPASMPAVSAESGSGRHEGAEQDDSEMTREVYAEMLTLATVSRSRPPSAPNPGPPSASATQSATPTQSASASVLSSLAIEDEEEMTQLVYVRQRIPRSSSLADDSGTHRLGDVGKPVVATAAKPVDDFADAARDSGAARPVDVREAKATPVGEAKATPVGEAKATPGVEAKATPGVEARATPADEEATRMLRIKDEAKGDPAQEDDTRLMRVGDAISAAEERRGAGKTKPVREADAEVTRLIRRTRPPADDETPTLMFAPSSAEILLPVAEKPAAESANSQMQQTAGTNADEAKETKVETATTSVVSEASAAKPAPEAAVEAGAEKSAGAGPAPEAAVEAGAEKSAGAGTAPEAAVEASAEKPAAVEAKPVEAEAGPLTARAGEILSGEVRVTAAPTQLPAAARVAAEEGAGDATEVDENDDPLLGLVIDDRYRLERVLGSGGMSRVYQATHVRSGGRVAIKIIELHLSHRPDTMKRCEQEARAMMEIQSNHVVRAYDVGTFPTGQLYVVMELLVGETLEHMIKRDGPIAWARVAQMALQVCSGLAAGHKRGIFHRDVKPQNCMRVDIDDNIDHVKLIDFGLARDVNSVDSGVTQEGVILGTPEYMAPELIASRATPDARSDVYALGATMYKLLTGSAVFHEKNALDTLFQHKHTQPRPPSQVAPDREIPEAIDALVIKALAKDPAQRFASVEEMAQALRVTLGLGETSNRHKIAARERSAPIVVAGTVNDGPVVGAEPAKRPVTSPSVVVQRRSPSTPPAPAGLSPSTGPASASVLPTPTVTERPFPWGRTAVLLLGLGLLAWLVWPPAGGSEDPTKIANVGPRDQTTSTSTRSPKIPPREIKAPPAPVVSSPTPDPVRDPPPVPVNPVVVDPPPVQPDPAVTPTKVLPPTKPADAPAFNYRGARTLIAEQHEFLRQTCMKKGKEPVRVLKFHVATRPNGRATVYVDGDAAVRACVKSVLNFSFPPSPDGASFDYTLWLADSRLDKRTH